MTGNSCTLCSAVATNAVEREQHALMRCSQGQPFRHDFDFCAQVPSPKDFSRSVLQPSGDTALYGSERALENHYAGFDNIFNSFLSLFIVASLDEWCTLPPPSLPGLFVYASAPRLAFAVVC